MKMVWTCRRTFIGLVALIGLTWIGLEKDTDVSIAIAGVVASIAGANAYEKSKKP